MILELLYKYSSLFVYGLRQKLFSVKIDENELFAVNNSRNSYLTIFITLFSSGLLFTGLIEMFTNNREVTFTFVIVFFVIHLLVGFVALRQLIWLINGSHEMSIKNGVLKLEKKGIFLTKTKSYDVTKIENLRARVDINDLGVIDKIKYNVKLHQKILFTHTLGEVLFNYDKKVIKIFSNMDKEEIKDLINKINIVISHSR